MTFPVSSRAALSSLALAITSTFAHAGEASQAAMASVLVTAARAPQAAADVLSDHTVLTAEDILRSGASNMVDLLQKQRGIEVARNGGPGANASVFLRGGDSKQTVLLVDGVRVGSTTSGIPNWSALPLANIDRIEIVYGPLATIYGADAIGGVVQVFTRRGTGAPQWTAAAGAGSDKARSIDAGVAGGSGAFSYGIMLARDEEEGFSATTPGGFSYNPDNDGYTRDSASASLDAQLAPGHSAGLLFMLSKLDAQYDNGASAFNARSAQQLQTAALHSSHQLSPSWRVRLQLARMDDRSDNYGNAGPTGMNSIDTRQLTASVQSELALGDDLLQMVLERRSEKVAAAATPSLERERDTNAAGASYSLKHGAHLASVSARIDDSTQYGSHVTGGLGYGYRITPALRLSASAGTSFRAPTFNELYYPSYGVDSNRPEEGRNVEAGLAWRTGASEATAAIYRNRLTDLLVSTSRCPVEAASHPYGCAYNVNRATLAGLSLGARTRAGGFAFSASMDFQDPRDDTTGKQLVRRARRHGSVAVEYEAGPLAAGAAVQASGKRFDDTANRVALGGYGVLNLFASYRFAPGWTALARWNNAAGKRYELARFYATGGSQLFAGVRYGAR